MTASNLHMYHLAHEMILDHLSPCAQFAHRSMSELFRHLFSSLLVAWLQDRSIHRNLDNISYHHEVYPSHQAGALMSSVVLASLSKFVATRRSRVASSSSCSGDQPSSSSARVS